MRSKIKRTKRKQIEFFNSGKSRVVSKITWLNDSSYMLIVKKCVNCPDVSLAQIGASTKVSITECTGNKFKCRIFLSSENSVEVEYEF